MDAARALTSSGRVLATRHAPAGSRQARATFSSQDLSELLLCYSITQEEDNLALGQSQTSQCDRHNVSATTPEPITSDTTADTNAALTGRADGEWLIARLASQASGAALPALTVSALATSTAVKILYRRDDLRENRELAEFALRISKAAKVRTTCSRIPDMVISDRQSATVFMNAGTAAANSIKTCQPEAISFLTTLFDHAWSTATPFLPGPGSREADRQAPGGRLELVETELRLLALLAAGATDETAARHLGVSLRTARRHMAAIMSRLAATSRFQAGVEAVRRGWLT